MFEDTKDFDVSAGEYKQQAPLNIPNFGPPSPISSPVPPIQSNYSMNRSASNPWSPAPLSSYQYDKFQNDRTITSPTFIKTSYLPQSQDRSFTKTRESTMVSSSKLFSKPVDATAFSNQSFTKVTESAGNHSKSFSRLGGDSVTNINDSSTAKMIKSADSEGCCAEHCSPRCKLGILGFVIGLLIICVPLAVVLVLWLRG